MVRKFALTVTAFATCFGAVLGCSGQVRASERDRPRDTSPTEVKTVSGFKVRLVAVADPGASAQERLADHAWTLDGAIYTGSEARLAFQNMQGSASGGTRRFLFFELEPKKTSRDSSPKMKPQTPFQTGINPNTTADVFAYIPQPEPSHGNAEESMGMRGPASVQFWHGDPQDSAGNSILQPPTSVGIELGVNATEPQVVDFGIAQGEFTVVAKGTASVAGLEENQTSTLASGPWGSIEATHLPRPQFESKPSPTHRFRLLGGIFPPKTERKLLFYDAKGALITTCGDGANNAGYAWLQLRAQDAAAQIASFEVRERPYEFVEFDNVSFKAPQFNAYTGQQGLDHALNSSIGKVIGVLKSSHEGPWQSSALYATDGVRWIDPGTDLAGYEQGQFDPWNHPQDDRITILLEPTGEFSSSTTPLTCEVFATDSPNGPRKEKLTTWNEMPFRLPMTQISCKTTTQPYLRIEVRVGAGTWKTLEKVTVNDRMLREAETGSPGSRVLEIFFDDDGTIRIWKDEAVPVKSRKTWQSGNQRIRVTANLRNGKSVEADFNMGGTGGVPPNVTRYRGLEYTRQQNGTHVQSGFQSIDMKDIASFDIQVQDLRSAVTIPVHSPAN